MAWSDYLRRIKETFTRALSRDDSRVEIGRAELETLENRPLAEPALDMYESGEEIIVQADVPGAAVGDVGLYVEGQRLILATRSGDEREGVPLRREWRASLWYRALTLPEAMDVTRTQARLKDGVLTVHIPKRREARGLLVPVKA
jgi:HSP20 family protein